ncbi:hypothetical protein VTJ49DRAFT_1560 [Mycothermus thermophilus]|uniref:RING-type E3 ubiquitin transferase n=1 Tax=Humicola insolens TaxID=85995 RepID=A0ABR3VNE7_HUMIN
MASTDTTGTGAQDSAPSGPRADRGRGSRGRGRGRGGRGRGRGGAHHHRERSQDNDQEKPQEQQQKQQQQQQQQQQQGQTGKPANFKTKAEPNDSAADADAEVCFICANPINHYSVAPCSHVTCHICALRLRALYKSKDCPHCRTTAPFVIFTDDPNKRYDEYTDADITSTDDNIGIRYAGEDIVGDTVLLLRYNCPDAECDFAGLGWQDLHRHVRSVHHKKMCDLCTRNKKLFTHEHEMFADRELTEHMRHGDDKPGAADQTGFRGHPLCGFCGARFYDSDKLYEHCRNKHERCFICDRRDSRQPHYYLDYNALEQHFKAEHFMCDDRECLEKKFVVFETELDLKAHRLSEHPGVYAKGRDARTVDLSNFDLRMRYEQERRGPAATSGRERRRGPDPNAEPLPVSSAQPLRRDEIAFQRQMALQTGSAPASASRPAASGPSRPAAPAQTRPGAPTTTPARTPIIDAMQNLSVTDLSSLTPEQRASLTRHGAVIERAANLLGNDSHKMDTFRGHISAFNKGSMTPEQLVDSFLNLFSETSSNALGTLVREVADLFEDKRKGEAVRRAWNNWRAINEDYPSLPGLDGMRGATTATTGWAAAAAASSSASQSSAAAAAAQLRNSTRVLKLKNSTRRGSVGGQSVLSFTSSSGPSAAQQSSYSSATSTNRPPISSSSAFPALPSAANSNQNQRGNQPSWVGGRGAGGPGLAPPPPPSAASTTIATKVRKNPASAPSLNSEEAFPSLPAAPKPQTTIFGYGRGAVRRDFGMPRETGFSWGGGAGAGGSGSGSGAGDGEGQQGEGQQGAAGAGKKKNKKQVLVHWG